MLDKQPIRISEFKGLYDRSVELSAQPQILEEIPFGYARTTQNILASKHGIQNRPPVKFSNFSGGAVINDIHYLSSNFVFSRGGGGDLYVGPVGPTLIQAGFGLYLSIVQRLFGIGAVYDVLVTSVDGDKNALLVNSGTGVNRDAAGAAPATAPAAANGAAGKVELGTHLITVAYETDSGFITKYKLPATIYVAPGALKINLTAIPVGPAGTIARHILASKVIHQFNGDTAAYEVFFVPGGKIADNVATVLTIDFYDTELIKSADYLNDLEAVLRNYIYLATYHDRAVYLKRDATTFLNAAIVLSLPGSFESISLVDGVLSNAAFNSAVTAFVYQDNLYVMTSGGQTYILRDNGGPPNTWSATIISSEITPLHNLIVGKVPFYATGASASKANQLDYSVIEDSAIIAAKEGIFAFKGTFSVNSVRGDFSVRPLTWNIDRLWRGLLYLNTDIRNIQIRINPFGSLFYVFGFSNSPNNTYKKLVLVGDYSDGLNWDTIKWFTFLFPFNVQAGDIAGNINTSNHIFNLTSGNYTYILTLNEADTFDNRDEDNSSGVVVKVPIDGIYETGLLPFSDNLELAQESIIRLNQRFDDYAGGNPQQLVQFGAGIAGQYDSYTYTPGDPRIKDFGFNLPTNRETFKWFFSTQAAGGYRAIELLDAIIFYSVRAPGQAIK